MNCRDFLRPVLLEKRMRRWLSILRYGLGDPRRKPQVRRNLARLLARHPEVGQKVGITVVGIYSL